VQTALHHGQGFQSGDWEEALKPLSKMGFRALTMNIL